MNTIALALALLALPLAAAAAPRGKALAVTDFSRGLAGWRLNDAPLHEGRERHATLVTADVVDDGPAGRKAMLVHFRPGPGWANAYLEAGDLGERWATAGVDEIRLWVRGDGSPHHVNVGLQVWQRDLVNPTIFQVPIALADRQWRRIAIPLSRLQSANPAHPLSLPALITFQIDRAEDGAATRVWVADIAVVNARGEGAPYARGLLDADLSEAPPPAGLPRFGSWAYPGRDPRATDVCRALGLTFSSNADPALQQQRVFLQGIATNHTPFRPGAAELLAGLGLTDADLDQDAQGNRTGEGVQSSIFHPAMLERYLSDLEAKVRARADSHWVVSHMLSSPISMYGEVHYAASSANQYAVHSRPAHASYRAWLRRAYGGDLARLSRAWGRDVTAWDDIIPPMGPTAQAGTIDARTEWSDFAHWYAQHLDNVTRRMLATARRATRKPLAVMAGGPKVGFSQGIAHGNVGALCRLLSRVRPAFFSDTDSQTLFSCRYTRAACSQYGIGQMLEHVGPPYLETFHQYNTALNVLSVGADHVHLAHTGQLLEPGHFFARAWRGLAPLVTGYRTTYRRSEAAFFHSYVTSWYRPDRSNGDTVTLYDATNTLWTPDRGLPSWGRVLGSPDVVDDAMVEDGGLAGRKLLVVPNSSVTVTTRRALDRIRAWVRAGGTLVGLGPGCLAYTVERDRSLASTPRMGGLLPEGAGPGPAEGWLEARVGKGRVVWCSTPADPALRTAAGALVVAEQAAVLERVARAAGVREWCSAGPDHDANLVYAGRDTVSGRHLFTLDLTRYVRNGLRDAIFWTDRTFDFTFDPSLSGDAELVAITDAFESSRGGTAQYDPEAHTLAVRFTLPGSLSLTFGKARSGLALARHPLLLWDRGALTLQPVGGWGVPQTQDPIEVTADGALVPAEVSIPTLVHGDMHRHLFGRGPTFRVAVQRPNAVTVRVNSVATHSPGLKDGYAVIVIRVDGKEMVRERLDDRDGGHGPSAREIDRDFSVTLEPGTHTVQVDNEGVGWFSVDRYVFEGLRAP